MSPDARTGALFILALFGIPCAAAVGIAAVEIIGDGLRQRRRKIRARARARQVGRDVERVFARDAAARRFERSMDAER